jgi:hypothetical protein
VRLPLALGLLVAPAQARADGEAWVGYEGRIRVHDDEASSIPPTQIRVASEARFNGRSEGLDLLFFRAGPIFNLAPWVSLALHFTTAAGKGADGTFAPQYRPEGDVVFSYQIGALALFDRNRFEGLLGAPGGVFRYRNMLRADYALGASPLGVFAFNEIIAASVTPPGIENRAGVGLRLGPLAGLTLDPGYMLRTRESPDGVQADHAAIFFVTYTPPAAPKAPALSAHRGSRPVHSTDPVVSSP